MSEKTLNNVRIVHKHDTEENWLKAVNFIPKQGELIIYDVDDKYNYERMKIGDGETLVNDLSFIDDSNLKYIEQNLSTDEIYQAKLNLLIPGNRKVVYVGSSSTSHYYIQSDVSSINYELINTLMSQTESSKTALTSILGSICTLSTGTRNLIYKNILPHIITNVQYLIEEEGLKPSSNGILSIKAYLLHHNHHTNQTDFDYINFSLTYRPNNDLYAIGFSTKGGYSLGSIRFYGDGTVELNTIGNLNKTDTTLALENHIADAKAVGEALNLKADISLVTDVESALYNAIVENDIEDKAYVDEKIAAIPQANWNQNDETASDYIQGRTHYKTNVYKNILDIIPTEIERTTTLSSGKYRANLPVPSNSASNNYPNTNNILYCIVYNDVEYYRHAYSNNGNNYLGNMNIYNPALMDTGEPFYIMLEAYGAVNLYTRQAETFTIKIYEVEESTQYVQLDEKFIPDIIARKEYIDESIKEVVETLQIATDEEILEMLLEEDMLMIVADNDGTILTDENNNILLW